MACDPNLIPLVVSGMPDGTYQLVEQPSDTTLCFNTLFGTLGDVGNVLTVGAGGIEWAQNSGGGDASAIYCPGCVTAGPYDIPDFNGAGGKVLGMNDGNTSLTWHKAAFVYDEAQNTVALAEGAVGVSFEGVVASGFEGVVVSGVGKETHVSSMVVNDIDIDGNLAVLGPAGGITSQTILTCDVDGTTDKALVRWNQVSGNFTSSDHGDLDGLGDDDHPQYVLSSTNNNLSSAYTNHAASTSVHFTEGSIDHGSIGGLGDDDHTQYHNDTRGDARYHTQTELGAVTTSNGASLIGISDLGSYTEATDVEGALQEIYPVIPSLTWSKYISYADQSTFWSGSTSYTSNPGVSNATNKQRASAGTNFTDGAERGHIWQLVIPAELDVTQPITATVYGRMGSAGGEGDNIEIEWSGAAQADNESMTTGTASTGAVVKDVSTYGNNDSIQIDLGTIWGGSTVAEGEFMHMTVFRDAQAGNTDDTFAGTFQYFGVELQGTRKPAFTAGG